MELEKRTTKENLLLSKEGEGIQRDSKDKRF